MAEITFKVTVNTSPVAVITFKVAVSIYYEINIKVNVIPSLVIKITFVVV